MITGKMPVYARFIQCKSKNAPLHRPTYELICSVTVNLPISATQVTAATLPWETSQVHNDNFQSLSTKVTHYSCTV